MSETHYTRYHTAKFALNKAIKNDPQKFDVEYYQSKFIKTFQNILLISNQLNKLRLYHNIKSDFKPYIWLVIPPGWGNSPCEMEIKEGDFNNCFLGYNVSKNLYNKIKEQLSKKYKDRLSNLELKVSTYLKENEDKIAAGKIQSAKRLIAQIKSSGLSIDQIKDLLDDSQVQS